MERKTAVVIIYSCNTIPNNVTSQFRRTESTHPDLFYKIPVFIAFQLKSFP